MICFYGYSKTAWGMKGRASAADTKGKVLCA